MIRWPGESDEAYPELFNTVPPFAKYYGKPGQVSDEDIKRYFREGFLVVENFFDRSELDPVRDAVSGLVDELAEKLYKAGKIKNLYKEHGFFKRLTKIEEEFSGANIILHKTGKLPQAFRSLWSNERLLNVVEQFIGPDIAGHPVWNLRTTTPNNSSATVPWHQDSAYMSKDSYNVFLFVAWVPLLNADEVNGCLQVAKNGHRKGKIAKHQGCWDDTWYIEMKEGEMEKTLGVDLEKDIVTCPIPYGGMLLFQNIVPHRSLPNLSHDIRWSLDLRWFKPGQPVGMFDLKEGVVMRSSTEPDIKIDWETFEAVDRNKLQEKAVRCDGEGEFDTTVHGPWMKQWEIVHHNRHTRSLQDDPASWVKSYQDHANYTK